MSAQQLSTEMRIRSLNLQFITSLVIILSIVKLHKQLSNLGKKKCRNVGSVKTNFREGKKPSDILKLSPRLLQFPLQEFNI